MSLECKFLNNSLAIYCFIASKPIKNFKSVILEHVPTDNNQKAIKLAEIASRHKFPINILDNIVEIREMLYPICETEYHDKLCNSKLLDKSHNTIFMQSQSWCGLKV